MSGTIMMRSLAGRYYYLSLTERSIAQHDYWRLTRLDFAACIRFGHAGVGGSDFKFDTATDQSRIRRSKVCRSRVLSHWTLLKKIGFLLSYKSDQNL